MWRTRGETPTLHSPCNQRIRPPRPPYLLPLARLLRSTEGGCEGDDSVMGDADLQAWNALFTEAILAESLGLVDRPTALKGPDGQWQGMVKTESGERRAIATVSKTHLLMNPGGF